jgi:hypothetical protein
MMWLVRRIRRNGFSRVANCDATRRLTDIFTDSGLPACKKTLYLAGFYTLD